MRLNSQLPDMPALSSDPKQKPRIGNDCDLYYEYLTGKWLIPLDRTQIQEILSLMRRVARVSAPANLHIVDDATIAGLNEGFIDCIGPTNIITFPPEAGTRGDLFLSADCLLRESRLYGQMLKFHFIRLLAHGFGHLCGLDHCQKHSDIESACIEAGINLIKSWDEE